jgi:flagellar hook protein FlgE
MSAISSPASALASAFDRFERSSARALEAVSGAGDADLSVAMAEQIEAKHALQANVAVVRFADEMWKALIDLSREPRNR